MKAIQGGKDAVGNEITTAPTSGANIITVDSTPPVITAVDLYDITTDSGFGDEIGDSIRITFSEPMADTDFLLNANDLETLLTFNDSATDGQNFDNVSLTITFTSQTTLEIGVTNVSPYTTVEIYEYDNVTFGSLATPNGLEDLAGNDVQGVQGGVLAIGTYTPKP